MTKIEKMKKAEIRAFEAFPDDMGTLQMVKYILREGFVKGYEQAEKDLALTWEDVQRLHIITMQYKSELDKNVESFPSSSREMFEEIIRRFKEEKK